MSFNFSDQDQIVTVHYLDENNMYLSSEELLIEANTGLPAQATAAPLPPPGPNQAAVYQPESDSFILVADYRGQTVYHTTSREPEQVSTLGEIEAGYTLLAPATEFDQFIAGSWTTDLVKQSEFERNQAVQQRRSAYSAMVDPLIAEAQIKRLQGKVADAEKLEQQALAVRAKIQADNPYPQQVSA